MKIWQKFLIIVIGCGLAAGLNYLSSVMPTWVLVFGSLNVAALATVGILTGWKTNA